jgi:hypothetical protein
MKHFFLTAALLIVSLSFSIAGGITKVENEAAIKAGRTLLTAKVHDLENNIKNNNSQAAKAAAEEVLKLMRTGMAQVRVERDLEKGDQQKAKAVNKRYLELETVAHQYSKLTNNVQANGQQLVQIAGSFIKKY